MRKRFSVIISLLMVMVMVAGTGVFAFADELSDKQSELSSGKAAIDAAEQELADLAADIDKQEAQVAKLQSDVDDAARKVAKAQKELNQLKDDIETQNDNLNQRLRNMYMNDDTSYVDVILSSGSISELLVNMDMLKTIHKGDKKVLNDLETKFGEVKKKEKKLAAEKADLEQKQEAEKTQLTALNDSKDNLKSKIASIEKKNQQTEQDIQDLIAAQTQASNTANGNGGGGNDGSGDNGSGGYKGSGSMQWPVPSSTNITCGYGPRICPFHGREIHSGIDISCGYGASIVAADDGVVVAAYYNGSYGNMVMIDHGGGIVTLYGHNSSLVASNGQKVKKGQIIARAGSTGNSTGVHCHFEVRVNGQHVNPMSYL